MQKTCNDIYSQVAQKYSLDTDMVKFVGDSVFAEVNIKLRKPSSLIIKIRHLGSFFMRRNNLLKYVARNEVKELEEQIRYDLELFKERVREYEKYIEKRDKLRKKRYETQEIIQPLVQEEDF